MSAASQHNAPIVIVGAGLAGYTVARELRKLDKQTPVVMICADGGGFYSKPMLSNALANGRSADSLVTSSAESMAAQLNLDMRVHTRVLAIDREAACLRTDQGDLPYAQLVLALGADPLRLAFAGNGAGAVLSVNDVDDYARFRQALVGKHRVALLGAGLIGCEFANDLLLAGYQVDLIDLASRPLARLLPERAGEFVRAQLAVAGVNWWLGTTIESIEQAGDALELRLGSGAVIQADVVLSVLGLRPRIALAAAAGLDCRQGVCVDRLLRTRDPAIYALGDCAEVAGLVLPYVMPIMQAARALVKTLLGTDTPLAYPAMPVVIKTPNVPMTVAPPQTAVGAWRETESADGVDARFESPLGDLLGFALVGAANANKAALAKLLPPWL